VGLISGWTDTKRFLVALLLLLLALSTGYKCFAMFRYMENPLAVGLAYWLSHLLITALAVHFCVRLHEKTPGRFLRSAIRTVTVSVIYFFCSLVIGVLTIFLSDLLVTAIFQFSWPLQYATSTRDVGFRFARTPDTMLAFASSTSTVTLLCIAIHSIRHKTLAAALFAFSAPTAFLAFVFLFGGS
jgi:hypothetical protein